MAGMLVVGGHMLNSTVLEVAIGLVFCYATVALIVSSINEAIASVLKRRSGTLFDGIKALLNDPNFSGLALDVYNHALVNPRSPGTAGSEKDLANKPSYIEPKNFAISFVDAVQTIPGNFKQLGEDIRAIKDPQLSQLLQGMHARASGDIDNLHTQLAAWFDAGMDRVSGDYKRQSQLYCFLIALLIAVLLNIDSIHLFKTLWEHSSIAAQIGMPSTSAPDFNQLMKLPIGWEEPFNVKPFQIAGWLITASATLFGGPFWFDLLQQLIRLRGTGPKPDQSNKTESSAKATPVIVNLASQPAQQGTEIIGERNAIVDLHSELNKTDDSYRPIQPEGRW